MSKKCIMPDFRKMYPDASEEVIAVLRQTERKMQYQEYDLKSEHIRVNQRNKAVTYVPSREDSWERLLSIDKQFPADQPSVEDEVICKIMYKQLHEALQLLAEDERYLIVQLYFLEKTEREIAALEGIYHNAVHKRKLRILSKLKKLFEEIKLTKNFRSCQKIVNIATNIMKSGSIEADFTSTKQSCFVLQYQDSPSEVISQFNELTKQYSNRVLVARGHQTLNQLSIIDNTPKLSSEFLLSSLLNFDETSYTAINQSLVEFSEYIKNKVKLETKSNDYNCPQIIESELE